MKSTLYEVGARDEVLATISVAYGDAAGARLQIADGRGAALLDSQVKGRDSNAAMEAMFGWLDEHKYLAGLTATGHRLVHGGARYREPQRITPEFLADLEKLVPLDPDHLPEAIRGIQFVAAEISAACAGGVFRYGVPQHFAYRCENVCAAAAILR